MTRQNSRDGERTACITLDLENNWKFQTDELQHLVFDRVDEYVKLIQTLDIPLTVFVVGKVLEERPDVVRQLDSELDAEFHLHSYRHDMNGDADIEEEIRDGVRAFESILGRHPRGYRAPRFIVDDNDLQALSEAGFEFDSSICPSYRPGVYNNLHEPTEPYFPEVAPDLLELPLSVHPRLRIPFAQSYLRYRSHWLFQRYIRGLCAERRCLTRFFHRSLSSYGYIPIPASSCQCINPSLVAFHTSS